MAYRAEIEIGVKGQNKLEAFQKTLKDTNKILELTNKTRDIFAMPLNNLQNYTKNLKEAAKALQLVEIGTQEETTAIRNYVRAAGEAAAVRDRQNRLMDEEAAKLGLLTQKLREYNAAAAPPRQVGSMAGAYLRPGESRLRGQTSPINPQAQIKAAKEEQIRQEQQLLAANDENIKRLRLRARIEEKIADVRSARIAREESASFLGSSGTQPQGPFAGAGALGFPVALPLLKGERKALDTANKIAEILERRKRLQKELGGSAEKLAAVTRRGVTDEERVNGQIRQRFGLRGALQALENKSLTAIKDANRQEDELTQEKQKQLELEKLINKERVKQSVSRRRRIVNTAKQARRRRKEAIGSGIIGGAFPLLFGQGAGAAVGGALGGVGGGLIGGQFGFGLSLVGTQLGSIFDQTIINAQEAGKALNSTGGALDFMREKSLFSTDAVKERAAQLEELGQVEELSAVLTQELVDKIGNKGVEALQGLGKETDETTRLWAELTLQLQALISGPLQGFLKLVNGFLGGFTTGSRFAAFKQDIADDPKALKRFNEIEREVRGVKRTNVRGSGKNEGVREELGALTTKRKTEILRRAEEEGLRPVTAKLPITKEDERRFTVSNTAAEKAVRNRQKALDLVRKLKAEEQATLVGTTGAAAERLKIQTEYEETLARISKLKNQDYATELQDLALRIKNNKEANLTAQLERDRSEAIRQAVAPIKNIRLQQELSTQELKDYNRLVLEGVLPSEAKRIAAFNKQVALIKNQLDEKILTLETDIAIAKALGAQTTQLEEQLNLIKGKRDAVEGEAAKGPGEALPDKAPKDVIAERVGQLKEELKELTNIGNIVVKGADSIGAAFSTAFQEVVSGSKSAQQALADMFRSVADDFLRMAAEIIAKQLIMIALQTLLSALGGAAASSGSSTTPPTTLPGSATQTGSGLNINGVDQGIDLNKAANGGPVKSGNPYIIGERGPELFVPRSNGRIVPNGRFGGGGGGDVNVVVNVDAKGSNAQGSDKDAKTLGAAIGVAVRSELVKQKRPGGLLAS